MEYASKLMEERETLAAASENLLAQVAERGSDLTQAERTQLEGFQTRCAEIDGNLGAVVSAQEASRSYAALMGKLESRKPAEKEAEQRGPRSAGEAFTQSPAFKEYRGHGTSAVAEYRAAGPTLLADIPSLTPAQFDQPVPSDRWPMFGLCSIETISGNSFEYVVNTLTDASAVVAEGQPKPESDFVQTLIPGTLDTIAAWYQISRQAMEDAPRVAGIINGKLANSILNKQNTSLTAALTAATLPANTVVGAAGSSAQANLLASIRQGVGIVEAAGFQPNAVLLNPADYAALDIAVLQGTLGGPVSNGSFWGMRAVASSNAVAGTATVGDFSEGLTLFRRSAVATYVTDSHASTFISNILTVLSEARSKAVVANAACFVECQGPAVPAAP